MKTMRQLMTALMLMISVGAYATSPTITGFSPTSGTIGTLLTITGTNLNSPTAFTIGGVSAIVVSNTGTTLVGMVMPGAVTGTVSVTTIGGTATGSGSFAVIPTLYPGIQQGNKLVGTGSIYGVNGTYQGYSVSLSAEGNTAIVGGNDDDNNVGAAWVYTRSGTVWTQQGSKLIGTGYIGVAQEGTSISLSADGNTAIVGGPIDNGGIGAVWIFTRSGGIWTQQGPKLLDTAAINGSNGAKQGTSVSLSADGNTAIVGGTGDNNLIGAAWIYTRSGGVWTQQGSKLIGTGALGAQQGNSVSLSADGNTAIVGGFEDNTGVGAAWVYTRSGGVWTQQGSKLVGTGAVGGSFQGTSVSLSADGNTAIIGGDNDNSAAGAAWVYTRSGGVWTQQGSKLLGTGAINGSLGAKQGISVSLSADGNTAIVGGAYDNSSIGATWVYTRSGGVWTQQGSKLLGTGAVGIAQQGISVSLSADGNTAFMGGWADNNDAGAAWVFVHCNTCGTDSVVWPGDADANHIVNNTDLLPIGLAFDSTGPVRAVQGIVWQGDAAANWRDSFTVYAPSVNFKYADCNGDGIINAADTAAIIANFSLTHAKNSNLPGLWRSGVPGFYLFNSIDTAAKDSVLTTSIWLGQSPNNVNNIYGLAFTFNYDTKVDTLSSFSFVSSWLGTPANSINLNVIDRTAGTVKAAITGINHTNRSGSGEIAKFRCIITTDNINGKNLSYYPNISYISDVTAIDEYGDPVPLNAAIDTSYVAFMPTGIHDVSQAARVSIYPNPASTQVMVRSDAAMSGVTVTDMLGQEVLAQKINSRQSEMIDISNLETGVYIIHVSTITGESMVKLIISR